MAEKKTTRRGHPEAIAKRRAARALNRIFSDSPKAQTPDRRSLPRKQRLLDELKEGKDGGPLKALDALGHATELLTMGETLVSLRKLKPKLPPKLDVAGDNARVLTEVQRLYQFDPRAWRLLGVDIGALETPAAEKPARKPAAKKTRASRKKR